MNTPPRLSSLRRLSLDELADEMEIAAAHGKHRHLDRCLGIWLDRMGWSVDDLAEYMAAKFRAGLH